MKKVILSEEQIKRMIDKLVINEQNVVVGQKTDTSTTVENKVFPTTQLGDKFEFGQYDSPNVKNTIESLKPQIQNFIKDSDSREFTINIVAGESQVTNPKGFETKGSLALARANSVKKYFQEIFPDLIKNGVLKIISPTDTNQVKIGETQYGGPKSGDNKNPEKIKLYKNEQFVNFNIVGVGSKSTTKTTTTNLVCNFVNNAKGGVAKLENDFLYNTNQDGTGPNTFDVSDLPDGSKIRVIFNTFRIPDLMTIQMGSYSYNTGFIGSRQGDMANDLATTLGNAYLTRGEKIPPQFPQNIIRATRAQSREYLKLLTDEDYRNYFGHIFPEGAPRKRDLIVYLFDEDPIKGYDSAFTQQQNKGDSKLESSGAIIDLIKKTGDTTLKINIYSPLGATAWRLETKCI
jgi:hypothetical protein